MATLPIFQFTAVDRLGNVVPSASVVITKESDGLPASLFSDRTGLVALSNPAIADLEGFVQLYVAPGIYRVRAQGGGSYREWRYVMIGAYFDQGVIVNKGIGWYPDTVSGTAWDETNAAHTQPFASSSAVVIVSADTVANQAGFTVAGFGLGGVGYRGGTSRGTPASPSASQSSDTLLFIGAHGFGTAWTTTAKALITFKAAENWSATVQGTYIGFETTTPTTTTRVERFRITNLGLVPSTNDGAAVGATGLGIADLYLASGGVIDWASSNVKITHATGKLTLDGALTVQGTAPSNIGLTLSQAVAGANAFAVYMGGTVLSPTTGSIAVFQYVGGGTVMTTPGTIGGAYALYAENITKSGANAISTAYSGYFATQTGGTTNYSIYAAGNALFNGTVLFPNLATTASAANAFLDNGAFNNLLRSTSSIKYKRDIEDVDINLADKVLELRPVWYRSKAEADPSGWSWYGLIAEEVAEIDPRLAQWAYPDTAYELVKEPLPDDPRTGKKRFEDRRVLKKGEQQKVPDGVQYDRISVLTLSVVKRLHERVLALEAQLEE